MVTALLLLVACGGGGPSPAGSRAQAPGEIVIGVVAPMSGELASAGVQLADGARLAADRARSEGLGVRIAVVDSGGTPRGAAAAAVQVIEREEPVALIGDVSSTLTLGVAVAADDRGVPLVVPAATHPELVGIGPGVVRICVTDDVFGSALARFAREGMGVTRVAVMRDATSDYSRIVGDAFARAFVLGGGEVVLEVGYRAGDVDFAAPLEQIRAAAPDAVVIPGYQADVVAIAVQARARSLTVPLLGTDGWDAPELLATREARTALEGSFYVTHWVPDAGWETARRFVEAYRGAYGREPGAMAAFGHDAARVVIDAAREAGPGADPLAVRAALIASRPREGATGYLQILPSREAARSVVVVRIEGGRAVYHTRIDPPEER